MIKAILDERKTQTRRILKPQPDIEFPCVYDRKNPYGIPGDILWVRETFRGYDKEKVVYRASVPYGNLDCHFKPWKPSIFMPRWASRITLEIINVRVERLQDISEEDAKAEGPTQHPEYPKEFYCSWKAAYRFTWESINGPGSWDKNPWVWAIEFKRIQP